MQADLGEVADSTIDTRKANESTGAGAGGPSTQELIDSLAAVISPPGSDLRAERREHALLYNLIGDPTLRLVHPESVSISVDPGYDRGSPIGFQVTSAIDGWMTASLHRPLGWADQDDPNEPTLATLSMQVTGGVSVRRELTPPSEIGGPVVLRVHVAGDDGWAAAAAKTRIR
jgi:hypothetical protein